VSAADYPGLRRKRRPDWRGLLRNILRKGTPDRTYHIELFHDREIIEAVIERFGLDEGLDPNAADFGWRRFAAFQRFCGLDYAYVGLQGVHVAIPRSGVEDTADLKRASGRHYSDYSTGVIRSWEDFERFEWPDPRLPEATGDLEWCQRNLPEDMCIIGGKFPELSQCLVGLMGYENLCLALYDQRDLVKAVSEKLLAICRVWLERLLQFDRVKLIWAWDDMGFKTGPFLSPKDMREFVLDGHRQLAEMAHRAGRPYMLHSCGNLSVLMDDLVNNVKIDAKHSFEDTIEDVREVKHTYGKKVALLGGIDVDFLCRSDPAAIRRRVRETLDVCQDGGGYCLGSGNSVANYIPLDNYLAMVDEGILWSGG
jgi:uroporphyrinogen decarboxylase